MRNGEGKRLKAFDVTMANEILWELVKTTPRNRNVEDYEIVDGIEDIFLTQYEVIHQPMQQDEPELPPPPKQNIVPPKHEQRKGAIKGRGTVYLHTTHPHDQDDDHDYDREDQAIRNAPIRHMMKTYSDHPVVRHDRDRRLKPTEKGEGSSDPMAELMQYLKRFHLLTKDDEAHLSRVIHAGVEAWNQMQRSQMGNNVKVLKSLERGVLDGVCAFNHFYDSNLQLVAWVAYRVGNNLGIPVMDRFMMGVKGLVRAIEKFNPEKGFKFSTYAVPWITQAIERGTINEGREIRIPVQVHGAWVAYSKEVGFTERDLGRPLTEEEKLRIVEEQELQKFRHKHTNAPDENELIKIREDARKHYLLLETFGPMQLPSLNNTLPSTSRGKVIEVVDLVPYTEDGFEKIDDQNEKRSLRNELEKHLSKPCLTQDERVALGVFYGVEVPGIDPDKELGRDERGSITIGRSIQDVQGDETPSIRLVMRIFGVAEPVARDTLIRARIKIRQHDVLEQMALRCNFDDEETAALFAHFFTFAPRGRPSGENLEKRALRERESQHVFDVIKLCFGDRVERAIDHACDELRHERQPPAEEKITYLKQLFRNRFGVGTEMSLSLTKSKSSLHPTSLRRVETNILALILGRGEIKKRG